MRRTLDHAHAQHRPISIHDPSGVRLLIALDYLTGLIFQSTHPSGVRRQRGQHPIQRRKISIHAPQWGATGNRQRHDPDHPHFNPRTPVGCDPPRPAPRCGSPYFNPRTPVGCDPPLASTPEPVKEFQSTHPSGVRRGRHRVRPHHDPISIHAPQWGATAPGP